MPVFSKQELLFRYQKYMEEVFGLAAATSRAYLLYARRLLAKVSRQSTIDSSLITRLLVARFFRNEVSNRVGQGVMSVAVGLRSFLRFLVANGYIQPGIESAVPKVSSKRESSFPSVLSSSEVAKLIAECSKDSVQGLRDRALLMVFSRLGLRVSEVAKLKIDDIDWIDGSVVITPGKNRIERRLPLAQDIATAIIDYLQARSRVKYREVFLRTDKASRPFSADLLGKYISRLMRKAGIQNRPSGAHLFRHSAATEMINKGAAMKEIADLLGHQSINTTKVYARLNLESLSKVALPWPGEEECCK